MVQVGRVAEVVDHERAHVAALVPFRVEHEVVDDELAAALEQVEQSHAAVRAFEAVRLLDLDHRQPPTFDAQLVSRSGSRFLLGQQLLASHQPLASGNDVLVHFQFLQLLLVSLAGYAPASRVRGERSQSRPRLGSVLSCACAAQKLDRVVDLPVSPALLSRGGWLTR